MRKEIEKFLLENTPLLKKRGWVFKLIWKTFYHFKKDEISEIWEIYSSLKSIKIDLASRKNEVKPYWNSEIEKLQSKIWLPKISDNFTNYSENLDFWKRELTPNFKIEKL